MGRWALGSNAAFSSCNEMGLVYLVISKRSFHLRFTRLFIHISDYGTKTCAGYPGSIKHIKKDAQVSQNYHYILWATYKTSRLIHLVSSFLQTFTIKKC